MLTAVIDDARCDRSPGCPVKRVCPRGAVIPNPGGSYPGAEGYTIDAARCTGCGVCVRVCPMAAVRLEEALQPTGKES